MVDRWLVETDLSDEWNFYTRANVGEVFPDPVAPLTFGWIQHAGRLGPAETGFRNAYYRIGAMERGELPEGECVLLGVTGGYCYLNASAMRLFGHRAPGMTSEDIDASFFGDAPGVPEFVVKPGFDRPDLTEKIGQTFNWVLTTPDLADVKRYEEMVNGLRRDRPDLTEMSDRELIEAAFALIDEYHEVLFGEHIFITSLATLSIGIISKVCAAVGRETDTLELLAGLGDVESAAPAMAMWDLGRIASASPDLHALFDAGYAPCTTGWWRARARTRRHSSRRSPTSACGTAPGTERVGGAFADVGDRAEPCARSDRPDATLRRVRRPEPVAWRDAPVW